MGQTLAIIGDSLTERALDHAAPPTRESVTRALLVAAGLLNPEISWYGKGGKQLVAADSGGKTTMQNIADARTALGHVDIWVIGLGTNNSSDDNATFTTKVNTILDTIYPTGSEPDHVYWVNLAAMNAGNTNYIRLNPVISAIFASRPQAARLHYLDWNTYIHSTGVYDANDWLASDIPHMTVQGYAKRDAYITQKATAGFAGSVAQVGVWTGTDERATTTYLWDGTDEIPVNWYSNALAPATDPGTDDDYPTYPTMLSGWTQSGQPQIDTSINQNWAQTSGVRTTDQGINRAANTAYGQGPDADAMVVTVTYDGTNYYESDARATFCTIPGEFVVEFYCKLEHPGSGSFPSIWFRPQGSGDGEIDLFEWKGKYFNISPTNLDRFAMNVITTLNGSYTNKKQKPTRILIDANSLDVTEWCHYRMRVTATDVTLWMNGIQVSQITRAGAASQITNAEWDRCFGNTHNWYLRMTYQFGIGTGADAGGTASPATCPTKLWMRDVRIWKRSP